MILKDTGLYGRKSESDPLEGYVDASCTTSAASKQGMLWPGITRYVGGVRGLGGGLSSQGIHYLITQNFWPYIFWQCVRTIHVNQQQKSQDGNSKQEKVADIQYSLLYFLYMLELPWVDSVCAFDSRRTNEIRSHWTLDFFWDLPGYIIWMENASIKETNHLTCHGLLHGIKAAQQTALSKSPLTELQFLFFSSFFFSSGFWWATEPFPKLCMHQQTCWYNLKGHVLFTLTEAFQNSDKGVPLKHSAVTLQQQK